MEKKKGDNFTILFIEDDETLSGMYKMKLEMEGFKVFLDKDGYDWRGAIKKNNPDLILLDILMTKKDGFDVLKEKGQDPSADVRDLPVIVLTNLASPDDQAEGKRLGCTDWWIKAYNTPAEVAKKVKDFLRARAKK